MSIYREGETGTREQRSARFFQKGSDWYFRTREGFELGPYDTCLEAHQGLKDYLEFINRADPKTLESFFRANVA